MVVLPHLDVPHFAATVAHHVIDQIAAPVRIRELNISVTPFVGIGFFPQHGLDLDTLIQAADLAMYQAKQAGAGSYEIYTPDLTQQAGQISLIEVRLKRALQQHQMVLHYQPVVDMRSGRLASSAEALLRLADEKVAPIGPDRFIPVAEAAGLITQLGEWLTAQACRQHAFAQRLVSIVREGGIDPDCLVVEISLLFE